MDKDCFLKVACMPQVGCKPLMLSLDHDSFAPFVEAKFVSELGNEIISVTVGNESYKVRPNTAAIKSMEWGYLDKPKAILEIVDEAGGEMGLFVDAIRKCGNTGDIRSAEIFLKFGWVKSNCESGMGEENRITFEGFARMLVPEIRVTYGEGLVKYTIEADGIDVVTTNQREDLTIGKSSKNGPNMRLTTAIERICRSKNIVPVYVSEMGDGRLKMQKGTWPEGLSEEEAPWVWEHFGTDGPRGSWQGDNNDVLSTISRWLEPYRCKHGTEGAGIKMVFDSKDYDKLLLWKDPAKETRCSGVESGAAARSGAGERVRGYLGTFIVNGGKCSPVIKFDPKFNFIAGLARQSTGGNASGSESSFNVTPEKGPDPGRGVNCPEDLKNTGPENDATIPQHAKENYPPNLVHKETMRSNMAHIKANVYAEFNIGDIQAELTIIGSPYDRFMDVGMFLGAPVSVIVINPFFVAGNINEGCGDWSWLSSSGCNQLLSSSKYICLGVNHSIREGSYTTTLKLINVDSTATNVLE